MTADENPRVDNEELERAQAIKLPLTIEHPPLTDQKIFRHLVTMLGGVDYLNLVKTWGHGPDDNFSDEVSDFEEKRSSGDESESDKDDEDSGSEIELDSLPMTPEPSQPSPRDKRDKRLPRKSQLPKPP